jgi:DeoR family transcriptional regulator, glycerol-3-phosphate regulon repressor
VDATSHVVVKTPDLALCVELDEDAGMGRYEHEVMNAVGLRGTVSVRELASLLDVSDQTIRRIVKPMVERGEVHKVHGAITSVTSAPGLGDAPFLTRMNVARAEKIAIATEVATLIQDGDTVALDSGSTTGFIAQALRGHRSLTIVTNSSFIATTLATIPGNRVHMAGVELRNHDGAAFDAFAFQVVRSMKVRVAVLSASAVDAERGPMVHEHSEAEMSAAMSQIADRRIIAVDASKWGRSALVALPAARSGDVVVTDRPVARGLRSAIAPARLLVASKVP